MNFLNEDYHYGLLQDLAYIEADTECWQYKKSDNLSADGHYFSQFSDMQV